MLDTYTLFGVEFNLLDLIMAILLLGTGIYCIYTSIRVRREYTFFENKVLLPGGCEPNACTDPDGFFDYIAPRLVLFGIALIFCAALELLVFFLSAATLSAAGCTGCSSSSPLASSAGISTCNARPASCSGKHEQDNVNTPRLHKQPRRFFTSPRAAFAARSEIPPAEGRKP